MRTLGRVGLVNSRGLAAAQTSRTVIQLRGMPRPAQLSVRNTLWGGWNRWYASGGAVVGASNPL
jgi:hypothetical protein